MPYIFVHLSNETMCGMIWKEADFNGFFFCVQLERLKDENLSPLLPLDVNLTDPSLSGLERTLSQLDMVRVLSV